MSKLNDCLVIEENRGDPIDSLMKSSMSRTLVHRTNKEFDKCAELLRNILTVQETRRNSKSSIPTEINRKTPQSSSSPTNQRNKKIYSKIIPTKLTLTKSNLNPTITTNPPDLVERRSSFSPSKSLLSSTTVEESSLLKTRSSPIKSRKTSSGSPSPSRLVHSRFSSPSKNCPLFSTTKSRQHNSPSPSQRFRSRRRILTEKNFLRSSSCGDLPSKSFEERTRLILDRFVSHLLRIRTISKQIRFRNGNSNFDSETFHLWNQLETSLQSALISVNDHFLLQFSFEPLRKEIFQLKKQLQTTNDQLKDFDQRRLEENYLSTTKTNSPSYSQLFVENQQLKSKCEFFQEKIESLERNNLRLIQRSTQQDLRSLVERNDEKTSENLYLLREEIFVLKQKLYHVYDDLATLFNRNHLLQISNAEQKQQLNFFKQQFNDLKQTAQQLLTDLDKRFLEEKMKRFLNEILQDQINSTNHFHPNHVTPMKMNSVQLNSSAFLFETPHKATGPPLSNVPTTRASRSRPSPPIPTTTIKLRPKSLFITPTILNDTTALSKLQRNRSPFRHQSSLTPSPSSTICDAESISTSSSTTTTTTTKSLYQQQGKRTTLYNSLPTLNLPLTGDLTTTETMTNHHSSCFHPNGNESGAELDQISDLTSKMFSSDEDVNEQDEEDCGIGVSATSTSSSTTIPSDAEGLAQL